MSVYTKKLYTLMNNAKNKAESLLDKGLAYIENGEVKGLHKTTYQKYLSMYLDYKQMYDRLTKEEEISGGENRFEVLMNRHTSIMEHLGGNALDENINYNPYTNLDTDSTSLRQALEKLVTSYFGDVTLFDKTKDLYLYGYRNRSTEERLRAFEKYISSGVSEYEQKQQEQWEHYQNVKSKSEQGRLEFEKVERKRIYRPHKITKQGIINNRIKYLENVSETVSWFTSKTSKIKYKSLDKPSKVKTVRKK